MKKPVVIIVGPTAVGKTELSVDIASRIDGEIISADSMQIYKFMNIGSAKPTEDEKKGIAHYLIDEVDPSKPFSVSDYRNIAKSYIKGISDRDKIPVITGGTGLYVHSIIFDMDFAAQPSNDSFRKDLEMEAQKYGNTYIHAKLKAIDSALAERIHPNNTKKMIRALEVFYQTGEIIKDFEESFVENHDYNYILVGLTREREELYDRINKRVDMIMEAGLLQELKDLLASGLTYDNISMKGIGYKELIGFLNGEYDLDHAVWLIKRNTRRYAKRQLTWFKRYKNIYWKNLSEYTLKEDVVNDILIYINSKL